MDRKFSCKNHLRVRPALMLRFVVPELNNIPLFEDIVLLCPVIIACMHACHGEFSFGNDNDNLLSFSQC